MNVNASIALNIPIARNHNKLTTLVPSSQLVTVWSGWCPYAEMAFAGAAYAVTASGYVEVAYSPRIS